ncbi:Alanyl-tRNA synthetase domain protein [Vibrio owensii]|uniref:alanine--tRNA ligase-related protein n=1 Tax=Vibrio owensii TaxID=696485 RepID=UPI002894E16A|nr:Alanyl-tRNA synthetase domain protein [Vibrio owensii]CAH1550792.1 Alanyl-tRNA synthetase domain protein [Vibrio owensii]
MTHKVFWDDPYQVELESTVSRVDGPCIELEETIFYAESGGQESDTGTIGGIQVIKAEKQDLSIVYTLEHEPNFQAGAVVTTQIDWARRYALMKLHFAAEVILEVVTHRFPEMTKVGAHISADKSRIDFEWHESIKPLLPELQQQAQSVIDSHADIISDFSDTSEQRRYWKVEGFAQVPCGGTHLKNTSEVGRIQLKRKNVGKGKERIEISLVEE